MNKNALAFLLFFLAIVIGINGYMRFYVGELKTEKAPVPVVLKTVAHEEPAAPVVTKRQPDDPAKYGIVVMSKSQQPQSQDQWDTYIQKIFDESKVLDAEDGREALKAMQMNPAQFEATKLRIDEEIKKNDQAISQNATDELLKKRRQVLYEMKALAKVLEAKGVVNADAPDLKQYNQP
jgi:hypothetical protein